jgi:hypothetical protein
VSKLGEGMRELERLEGERSDMISRIELLSRDQDSRYSSRNQASWLMSSFQRSGLQEFGVVVYRYPPDKSELRIQLKKSGLQVF